MKRRYRLRKQWTLFWLRLSLSWVEFKLNRNWWVNEYSPLLDVNVNAIDCLSLRRFRVYLNERRRLCDRARCRDHKKDVRDHLRAKPGWLAFEQ